MVLLGNAKVFKSYMTEKERKTHIQNYQSEQNRDIDTFRGDKLLVPCLAYSDGSGYVHLAKLI